MHPNNKIQGFVMNNVCHSVIPFVQYYYHFTPSILIPFTSFRATLYHCPVSPGAPNEMSATVSQRILDLQQVIQTTQREIFDQLENISQKINVWQQQV